MTSYPDYDQCDACGNTRVERSSLDERSHCPACADMARLHDELAAVRTERDELRAENDTMMAILRTVGARLLDEPSAAARGKLADLRAQRDEVAENTATTRRALDLAAAYIVDVLSEHDPDTLVDEWGTDPTAGDADNTETVARELERRADDTAR